MDSLTSYADIAICLTCPNTENLENLYQAEILNKLQIFIYIEVSFQYSLKSPKKTKF